MDETTESTADEIAGQDEGTVASMEVETDDAPDVVPARDLMALKDKNERLKAQLKEEREARKAEQYSRNADSSDDDDFSNYTDEDKRTLEALTRTAEKRVLAKVEAANAQRDQKESFSKKLDNTVDQQLEVARQNGVNVPPNVDKNLIKQLALANPKEKISALIERFY